MIGFIPDTTNFYAILYITLETTQVPNLITFDKQGTLIDRKVITEENSWLFPGYIIKCEEYTRIEKENLNLDLPILFKPMGSTKPEMNFIISDADFVDWLTEAMGGYAMPNILKEYRKGKDYLFLGVDFSRDTFRMVTNEITIDLNAGLSLFDKEELTKKEDKFIKTHNLEVLNMSINNFINSNE